MKTVITKGLEKDQAAEMEGHYNSAIYLRERINQLLKSKVDLQHTEMASKKVFDTPSWSHKQAFSLGYCNAIEEVISMLS